MLAISVPVLVVLVIVLILVLLYRQVLNLDAIILFCSHSHCFDPVSSSMRTNRAPHPPFCAASHKNPHQCFPRLGYTMVARPFQNTVVIEWLGSNKSTVGLDAVDVIVLK